jgi:deazaflavin-dependent oxidoreductase (nitroreductase family)
MSAANRMSNPLVSFLYRASGGRIAGRMGKAPIMLLTTKGSKSGKQRTNPVLYMVDGENLVTVASAGGAEKNPSWFVNLMHNPEATVAIKKETKRVLARKASPEERQRLWPLLTAMFPNYGNYANKTKREIPVVILAPVK